MNVHKNARTTPHSRARIAGRVAADRPARIARDVGVCERTVKKWVARAAEGGLAAGGPVVPPASLAARHPDRPDGRDRTLAASVA